MTQPNTDADTPTTEFDLNGQQADAIRQGLAEIVEAGRLIGSHEEESE